MTGAEATPSADDDADDEIGDEAPARSEPSAVSGVSGACGVGDGDAACSDAPGTAVGDARDVKGTGACCMLTTS